MRSASRRATAATSTTTAPTARATVTVVFTGAPSWGQSPVRRRRSGPPTVDGGRRRVPDAPRNPFAAWGRMGRVSPPSPAGPFAALPPQVDLPALEQQILQRWEADKVFARSLEGSAGRPQWVFYEGPPT